MKKGEKKDGRRTRGREKRERDKKWQYKSEMKRWGKVVVSK